MHSVYTLKKQQLDIDFQNLITKLVDIIQVTKDQDTMGRDLLCTCSKQYIWILVPASAPQRLW